MEETIIKEHELATKSIFEKLDNRSAISSVPKDQVGVLKPQDTQSAIGVRELHGSSCLILMGTSPRSAIITAHISASDDEDHHMSLVRRVISIFIKEQELFQLPLAWGIFGVHYKDITPLNPLGERTFQVFQHIHVELRLILYDLLSTNAAQLSPARHTVVVVRHEAGLPELYVEDRLVYPSIHSGSLTLEHERLGLRQIDYEHEDDGDYGNNEEESESDCNGREFWGIEFTECRSKSMISLEAYVGKKCERY